ncbi:STAS domain-containing protein [Nonomuraea dietziae]|uniref:STAS domain-containing protein n=1 Tax=Nonomuraea dietziae TaxID=65515 RepID=UPI00340EE670
MAEGSGSGEHFGVSIGLHEDFVVARAVGELDYASAGLLRRQVKDTWEATKPDGLVLDLGEVSFCDSMGVGVLVLLLKQSREQNTALVLSSIPPLLERILTITGLRTAFQVAASVEEAIQVMQTSTPPAQPEPAPKAEPL